MLARAFDFIKKIFKNKPQKTELIKFELVFLVEGILADERQKKLILYRVKRELSILLRSLRLHLLISEEAMNESLSSISADVESNSVLLKIPPKIKIKLQKELSENYSIKII